MTNDTVSDMLTRIRNANNSKHHLVQVPATKMTRNIVAILKEEGFIEDFEFLTENSKNSILISSIHCWTNNAFRFFSSEI